MKGILIVLSLFLACIPFYSKASTNLEVHALSGFKIGDQEYGFIGTMQYGRLVEVRMLFRDLFLQSGDMTHSALDEALGRRLQNKVYTTMIRLDDILKSPFDFFTFRQLMKINGATVIIVVPPPSLILPGSPEDCNEAPMLELDPQGALKKVCKHDSAKLHQSTMNSFYDFLTGNNKFKGLIALVEEDERALHLMQLSGSNGGNGWLDFTIRYKVNSSSHKKVSTYTGFNMMGTLKGTQEGNDSDHIPERDTKQRQFKGQEKVSKPKIVICSHFDTFSLLQSYRTNASNNTGLIAVLEIARLLQGVNHKGYEVVMLLTSGSPLNFHGANIFANSYSDIDDVELILCLDDLTSPELYVHESSKAKEFSQKFQLNLSDSVTETVKRGINAKAKVMFFQHEQFTRQKVHSLTVTSSKDLKPMPMRQRSFEYKCNRAVLANHITAIAQSLAKALQGMEMTLDRSDLEARIAEWEEQLATPRCGLSSDLYKDRTVGTIVKYLRTILTNFVTQKVTRKTHGYELYSNEPIIVTFYRTRTNTYHVFVFCSVCAYILMMWSLIRGSPMAVYDDIMKMVMDSYKRAAPGFRQTGRPLSKYKIV